MTDERRGRPSASSMYRLANCPGSLAMEEALRSQGRYFESTDPAASSGTRIHAYLAALELAKKAEDCEMEFKALSTDELVTVGKCIELREQIIKAWAGPDVPDPDPIIEHRYWYRQGLWPLFSGRPDYIRLDRMRGKGLIVNFKSGRVESAPAADNLQLMCETVLLKHNEPDIEEIDAVIDEPWVTLNPERVRYAGATLLEAENRILEIVDRSKRQADKRIPGPWCTYCRARAYCPEARQYIETVPDLSVEQAIRELPRGEAGVALWEKIKLAKKLLATLEETYTTILETEPAALPGYILPAEGRERRAVTDPRKLKAALAAVLTEDEVDQCADYHLGKIQELYGTKTGVEKVLAAKPLEKAFNKLVGDAVSVTRDKPFIRPMTKREREAVVKIADAREVA